MRLLRKCCRPIIKRGGASDRTRLSNEHLSGTAVCVSAIPSYPARRQCPEAPRLPRGASHSKLPQAYQIEGSAPLPSFRGACGAAERRKRGGAGIAGSSGGSLECESPRHEAGASGVAARLSWNTKLDSKGQIAGINLIARRLRPRLRKHGRKRTDTDDFASRANRHSKGQI